MTQKTMTGSVLFILAAVCACSNFSPLSDSGGSTSEVVGRALYANGQPAGNVVVRLRSTDFLTDTANLPGSQIFTKANSVTDVSGYFSFSSVAPGEYLIEVNDGASHAFAQKCPVLQKNGTVRLSADTLLPTGTVRGVVMQPVDSDVPAFARVFGLDRLARVDPASGSYVIDNMPPGSYSVQIISTAAHTTPVIINSVAVSSGQQTIADSVQISGISGWRFARKILFNTTATGADVSSTLANFPVLVRLNSANFPFNQAKPDGSDLRFAKADDTPLPFEIERWDAASQSAEIWVKVDTIFGNDSTHSIIIYYGNQSAAAASAGAAVFGKAEGFQSVWHLGDNTGNSIVLNALGNYNGMLKTGGVEMSTNRASSTGIIGAGLELAGAESQWIDLGANRPFVNGKQEITLSVWMRADNFDTARKVIMCFSQNGTLNDPDPESRASIALVNNTLTLLARGVDNSIPKSITSTRNVALGQWYHIAGIINLPRDSMYLYVNGELWVKRDADFGATTFGVTNSTNSAIGANDNGTSSYFSGSIDEARLETTARSADWIRLTYLNQSQSSRFIDIK